MDLAPIGSCPGSAGGLYQKEAGSEPRGAGRQKKEKTRTSSQEKETNRGEEKEEGRS